MAQKPENEEMPVIRLDRQLKYQGNILKIYEDTVLANGHEAHWDYIHHDGAAAVLPVPDECAYRELEEETGFKTEKLEYLISVNTTVAFCDEAIDIFVAHNLVPSHQHLDEDEVIEVEAWELKDLEELIFTGKITDGKTIAAIMAYGRKYRSVDKKDEFV